jgi:hypothetical protein
MYSLKTAATSSIPTPLTGRELALKLRGRTAAERAFTAAKLVKGEILLVGPTLRQAAKLARVSADYAAIACKGAAPTAASKRRSKLDAAAVVNLIYERVSRDVQRATNMTTLDIDLLLADGRRAAEQLVSLS